MRNIFALLFICLSLQGFSQTMLVTGTIQDTTVKAPLPNAVIMAVRFKDSSLVAFTRTNKEGYFKLANFPIDTYTVTVSHTGFGDKTFYLFGSKDNSTFDFGKFIMPPKSVDIKEVVIYAFKDPVYYKGDTLVYTADSFKVKPNATVEDLLKRLPGIQVDAQGKITANGEKVDQVLVDGDEFFGSDPTIATRNLNATSVQSVNIYEKQNENATGDADKDKIKVMDLKLKDDAKKGYFGKASAASDFNKFYESSIFANKFDKKEKLSLFGLGSNTPNNYIGWNDMYKYGLNTDNYTPDDNNGDNDENMTYYSDQGNESGIPRVFKTGAFYSNKFSDKTKLTANYSYTNSQRTVTTNTNSQYYLTDTSYKTQNLIQSTQKSQDHTINIDYKQSLDSLTDIEFLSKFSYSPQSSSSHSENDFLTDAGILSRSTSIENSDNSNTYTSFDRLILKRHFKKKDRLFSLSYTYSLNDNHDIGYLKSGNYSPFAEALTDSINQKKLNSTNVQSHAVYADYIEPLSKKIKLDFSYNVNLNISQQNIQTLDFSNGDYTNENSLLTNDFKSTRTLNRAGVKFSYEIKKQRIYIGTFARTISLVNKNLIGGGGINQTTNNLLPYAVYTYIFSDNRRITANYITTSKQPTVNQLQPVLTNTDPNFVSIGNLNLRPTYKQELKVTYYASKPVTGNYIYTTLGASTTHNDISNTIHYDSIGRTLTQPVNVNGNYGAYGYLYASLAFFSRVLTLSPNASFNYNNTSNFINDAKNITQETNTGGGLDVNINADPIEFSVGGRYSYSIPSSSLNSASNVPYSNQNYTSRLSVDLPLKLKVETTADYTFNNRRFNGYNLHYLIWNASLSKTFFKRENLIISLAATDLLNQNISEYRNVQDNVITDTKTNAVGRYLLLRLVYKFDSAKKVEGKDDE